MNYTDELLPAASRAGSFRFAEGGDTRLIVVLYAMGYMTKPSGFEQFMEVVQPIKNVWFTTVKLPPT